MNKHPYESIVVDYVAPKRPEHMVQWLYRRTDGICTEGFTSFDGHPLTQEEQDEHGWKNLARWMDETSEFLAREKYGNDARYDAIQIAIKRRILAFGEPQGAASNTTTGFESWLMDNGFRPVMIDRLNAMSPGRVLGGKRISENAIAASGAFMAYTHIYYDGETEVSLQFGYGPFNFVFMVNGHGPYQVPVDETLFQDALDLKLPHLDRVLFETHRANKST